MFIWLINILIDKYNTYLHTENQTEKSILKITLLLLLIKESLNFYSEYLKTKIKTEATSYHNNINSLAQILKKTI